MTQIKKYKYDYPRPMVTVDAVIFAISDLILDVLVIKRGNAPFAGSWALPGGFVEIDEGLDDAAARELEEETGLANVHLEQFYTFGNPGRDPRGRSISVAYIGLTEAPDNSIRAADDAAEARWFPVDNLPELAFDHEGIIKCALARLRTDAKHLVVGRHLLSEPFRIRDLQDVHEGVLGQRLDTAEFERTMLERGLIEQNDAGSCRFTRSFCACF